MGKQLVLGIGVQRVKTGCILVSVASLSFLKKLKNSLYGKINFDRMCGIFNPPPSLSFLSISIFTPIYFINE